MPRPYCEVMAEAYNGYRLDKNAFIRGYLTDFIMSGDKEMLDELTEAIILIDNADTLGSIMKFNLSERTRNMIDVRLSDWEQQDYVPEAIQKLFPYIRIILALTDKYAAICMNPPYMGSGRFDTVLSKYTKDNYPRSKADLFSVFMDVAIDRLAPNGKYGMINMHSWMFLSSFEELRRNLLDTQTIDSLLHLGPRTFDELSGEVVQNASFVISNASGESKKGTYFRLVDGKNCSDKSTIFIEACLKHTSNVYFPCIEQHTFEEIPGNVLGYWISDNAYKIISSADQVSDYGDGRQGIIPGNASVFIHLWNEVEHRKIGFNHKEASDIIKYGYKWFPYNKGGGKRKWYGNNDYVIDFENDAYNIKHSDVPNYRLRDSSLYFRPAVTWSKIMSDCFTARVMETGFLFDSGGCCIFNLEDNLNNVLGYLNSPVAKMYMRLLSPTLNYEVEQIGKLPYIGVEVSDLVAKCVHAEKLDWDAHETSWDFQTNELLRVANGQHGTLEDAVNSYRTEWERNFETLHENEEELNRQFIDIYGLQDELTPDVPLSEITILQAGEITHVNDESEYGGGHYVWNYDNLMKQLVSYAVGCMMGRYSIDKPGLVLANQGDGLSQFNELVPDSRFEPDDDGIIPLMSSNTEFADAAAKRFKTWLANAFGEENLQENLNFIRTSLGKDIDDYFVKDFWKDHKKMYQNRPIYWLFSSKKGAFQCLAYMHRMNPYTAETIRTKYLLPHIEWLTSRQNEMQENAANLSPRERKELDNITAQIAECREYHDRLHVVADQQIGFDLDDGVVVNYAKFGDVLSKLK